MNTENKKQIFIIVISAIISIAITSILEEYLTTPQIYYEFIHGNLILNDDTKNYDFKLVITLAIAYIVSFIIIRNIIIKININEFTKIEKDIILMLLPSAFNLGTFISSNNRSFQLIEISAILVVSYLILFKTISSKKHEIFAVSRTRPGMICCLALYVGLCAIFFSMSRISLINVNWIFNPKTYVEVYLICLIFTMLVIKFKNNEECFKIFKKITLISQITYPLFLFGLVPSLMKIEGTIIHSEGTNKIILFIAIIAIINALYLLKFSGQKNQKYSEIHNIIVTPSYVFVLFFFIFMPSGLPILSADDYHYGEQILPWYSLKNYLMMPYIDIDPVRGIIAYISGIFSTIFYNGSAIGYHLSIPFSQIICLLCLFLSLRIYLNVVVAFIATLCFPIYYGLPEIDAYCISAALVIIKLIETNYKWKYIAIIIISNALILLAPAQGLMILIPLSFFIAKAIYFEIKRKEIISFTIGVAGILFVISLNSIFPVTKITFNAILYVIDQAANNVIANSIAWKHSFNNSPVNKIFYQALRASFFVFLLYGITTSIVNYNKIFNENENEKNKRLIIISIFSIFLMLFSLRAFGRIDGAGPSRMGLLSLTAVALLYPFYFIGIKQKNIHPKILSIWCFILGAQWSVLLADINSYVLPQNISSYVTNKFGNIAIDKSQYDQITNGANVLPAINNAIIDNKRKEDLMHINQFLKNTIADYETYLDLSSRSALYFYLSRVPYMRSSSSYNTITINQQENVIDKLKYNKPKLILLYYNNIEHDGGGVALRNPILFRYILDNFRDYLIANENDRIWLVAPELIKKLENQNIKYRKISNNVDSPLLKVNFKNDLNKIPYAWGRSYEKLIDKLKLVANLNDITNKLLLNSVVKVEDNFIINGNDPYIYFELKQPYLSGNEFDYIAFDFYCNDQTKISPVIEFYWAAIGSNSSDKTMVRFKAENGKLIIPTYYIPTLYLSDKIIGLRFDLEDPKSCSSITLKNIQLYKHM